LSDVKLFLAARPMRTNCHRSEMKKLVNGTQSLVQCQ